MEKTQDFSDGVEIMTTFMSKGLEFDIVFPIALLHRHTSATKLIRCQGKLVPFDKTSDEHNNVLKLHRAERLRQLYVAMTRAKKRLYLPHIIDEEFSNIFSDHRSSLELFLPGSDIEDYINQVGASSEWMEILDHHPRYICKNPVKNLAKKKPLASLSKQMRDKYIESFSSLTKGHNVIKTPVEDLNDPLPSGKKTGLLLHTLIEQMILKGYYKDFKSKKAKQFIASLLNSEYKKHEALIVSMIEKVFLTPIIDKPLSAIPFENMAVEFAFTFREKETTLTGFIDLVVIYNGKIFVIDWKTNQLPNYSKEAISQEVEAHQYALQSRIYKSALLQSLRVKTINLKFGGSYYIFLRGLKSNQGVVLL